MPRARGACGSAGEPGSTELQQLLGPVETLECERAEARQLPAVGRRRVDEGRGRARHEYLAGVGGRADSSGPVHLEADVVVRRALGAAGVDPDPRKYIGIGGPRALQHVALDRHRSPRRVVHGGEDAKGAVALGVDDDTAMPAGGLRHGSLERSDDRRVRAGELTGDPRRVGHVDEYERHRPVGEVGGRSARALKALGQQHRQVVEDELGELTGSTESPVGAEPPFPDPSEKPVQGGVTVRRRLLHVDQLRATPAPLELVLDPGDGRVRCHPAVALPVDAHEHVALVEIRAIQLVGAVRTRADLEPHRGHAQRSHGGLDRVALRRELPQRRGDEDPDTSVRRENRDWFRHRAELYLAAGVRASTALRLPAAPVAQWIEQRFPKPRALVRFRPGAPRWRRLRLQRALSALACVTGILYLVVGIAGGIWPGHWDDTGAAAQILWFVFGIAGGVLVLAGWRLIGRSPKLAATLISLGGVVGALPIFWTIVPLLLAIALIALSVLYVRRTSAAKAMTEV